MKKKYVVFHHINWLSAGH